MGFKPLAHIIDVPDVMSRDPVHGGLERWGNRVAKTSAFPNGVWERGEVRGSVGAWLTRGRRRGRLGVAGLRGRLPLVWVVCPLPYGQTQEGSVQGAD